MSPSDCIFCKIARKEIPTELLYEDDDLVAFDDINPAAPTHFLIVPKSHIETLDDTDESHERLLGRMLRIGAAIAREKGVAQSGYREVINCRKDGGQEVFHLHMHILGGRAMRLMG